MRWRSVAIAGGIALAISVLAIIRIARSERITLPQHTTWLGPDGVPLVFDRYESGPCNGMMDQVLVLGDRLIVPCTSHEHWRGYAWIEPRTKTAKIAWPLPDGMTNQSLDAIAVLDPTTFAVGLAVTHAGHREIVVGVAGKDGWIVAPTTAATYVDNTRERRPLVLGMGWIDQAIEIVLTHPTVEDPFGARQPPDVVRIAATGKPVTQSRAITFCPTCRIAGALPGVHGWKLLVTDDMAKESRATLIDEAGAGSPAPPALQWWGEFGEDVATDRTALGTLWGMVSKGAQVAERDGTRHPPPPAPIASWQEVVAFHRFVVEGNLLRRRALYSADDTIAVLAQVHGGRTLVTAAQNEDIQHIGDSVEHLHPVLQASSSYEFKVGAFLPAPSDGLYWVISDGSFVTLDRDLHRTDPRSLIDHLRTRGSTGDFIDEPIHVVKLFVLVLAVPVAMLLAAAFCLISRRTPRWRPQPFLVLLSIACALQLWAFVAVAAML